MKKTLLAALILTSLASGQTTILDETFPLNGRTTLNPPSTAAWYSSSGGSNIVYTDATSIAQNTGGAGRHLLAYFTPDGSPVTLVNTGDYIRATFTFSFYGSAGTSAGNTTSWRLGLFDSTPGTRVNADGLNTVATFSGYTGYAFTASPTAAGNMALRERTNTEAVLISDNTAYTAFSGAGTSQALTLGQNYTGELTLTRTASGLDISIAFSGPNVTNYTYTRSDATPTYSFDTFAFYTTSNVTDGYTISALAITAIPEPSTYAIILGLVALVTLGCRRNRLRQP